MAVKIRLTRLGKKKKPVYRIVVMNERSKRDGAALETLGTYDPLKDHIIQYHAERFAFWKEQGAQPTNAVKKIMRNHSRLAQVPSQPA
jgi:small subunit ribosomal protein S16